MAHHYSDPERAADDTALPNVEVFYMAAGEGPATDDGEPSEAGWFWWPCFPGCLPDGEAYGPFASEAEALADAQDGGA